MTLLRLLPAVLLVCAIPTLGQEVTTPLSVQRRVPPRMDALVIPPAGGNTILFFDRDGTVEYLPIPNYYTFDVTRDGRLAMYATCYSMRSYVVARDEKNSDSTHFVRYSTCQPANRFRLKSVETQRSEEDPAASRK